MVTFEMRQAECQVSVAASDVVKVGMVGLGYWGPQLARNFHSLSGAELAWVCDLDPARLAHVHSLYPEAHASSDFSEMLDSDVEAICIATPVRTHYQLALRALRAGKHVLIEKPLAACERQAEELVKEADALGRIVMVGHTFVYNPAVVAMKELISRGVLGELYYISSTRVNLGLFQPDINVAWDLAPHDISILLYILGMSPLSASARGAVCVQRKKGFHDVAYLTLNFPNGLLADIRVSWLDPCKIRRYTVVGTDKMLVYDDVAAENKLLIYDKGVTVPYSDTEAEFHLSYRTGEGVPYPFQWVEPLRVECQHFLNCIRDGSDPRSSGRVGLEVVRILEAATSSLLKGGSQEVIGESRGFCAHRARRETGARCQDLCLRELVRM